MEEIWKDIEGYEGLYQASDMGRVKSLDRFIKRTTTNHLGEFETGYLQKGKILKVSSNRNNRGIVTLYKERKKTVFKVNMIIAKLFLDNPNSVNIVKNIDGDLFNNKVDNLRWNNLNGEAWRDIDGYKGLYQVSNMGRIRSLDRIIKIASSNKYGPFESKKMERGQVMKTKINYYGGATIVVSKEKRRINLRVDILVAKAFLDNPHNIVDVRHIDGNLLNNKLNNLKWDKNIKGLDGEIWRDIKGYEGIYQVSDLGRVKSLSRRLRNSATYYISREKFLSCNLQKNKSDNIRVRLTKNKKTSNVRVDMLVLNAFYDISDTPVIVENIDGDVFNNKLDNLKWYRNIKSLPGEVWRTIEGYSNYMVSNKGRVKSLARIIIDKNGKKQSLAERLLIQVKRIGYCGVSLRSDTGKTKSFSTHRVVAITFIPNLKNKPMVNHIDGDKTNNNVENLEWVDAKENAVHAVNIIGKKNFRPVVGINLKTKEVVEFCRITKAVEFLKENGYPKASGTSISKCCKNIPTYKTSYGYTWEYKNKDKVDKNNKKEKMFKREYDFGQLYLNLVI